MNLLIRLFILCGITVLFAFCKTQQYTATEYKGEKIIFGNFGGFTGEMEAYHLLSNGQLFAQEGRTDVYNELANVPKKETKALFEKCLELGIDQQKLDNPGNMSYFIEYRDETVSNKLVWSDEGLAISPELQGFFEQLHQLLSPIK